MDLLAVQKTLKSLLQHHSSKASVLQFSAFFIVQLSHPYVTTGKTTARHSESKGPEVTLYLPPRYSLMSFRIDWLDLLVVQGTLESLLQHHSSKASILRRSAFFIVQLSHPYMTTGKTKALTRWTFVGLGT